ncbi:MAG: transcriptional regulator, CdaR [Modestobacter sp.]|jgi:sugar diacid utilization regulator|nr:transcriptional regulator, CdaR [Modestobacter sp.]
MDDADRLRLLPDQASSLRGLSTLPVLMFDGCEERDILRLATASVPALGPCQVEACYLVRGERLVTDAGGAPVMPDLTEALTALGGDAGPVAVPQRDWAWAYPLRCPLGNAGYIVVSAAAEPVAEQQFLLARLAQQTGGALSSAALYRGERAKADELRVRNAELAAVNDRLSGAVAELEWQRRTQETLTAVAAARTGGAGIAEALHRVSTLPVAVEDRFGNAIAWVGPDLPEPGPRHSRRRRAELLARAGRAPGPLRDQDRLIALVRCGDEVLGVLALIDPQGRAGPHQVFALEHAAVVLGIELAHQRDLAEAALRLRGDLVADLLSGIDTESALSRAAALGHDLRGPHQVLVLRWRGAHDRRDVTRAVEQGARLCDVDACVARRSGLVVVVAARPGSWGGQHRWGELYQAVADVLRSTSGCIGVGGVREDPSELPRSYSEALHALAIQERSQGRGVMTFEELGVLRLVFTSEDTHDVEQFVRDWIGELIDYDGTKRTQLVATLSQYYDSGCNYDATATALHIHRSTLRYRLKRIRELTGHDLGAVDGRLNLQVATRAWLVLHGPS